MNDSRPWWLWPNLLSLDAPAVAVLWQIFLASAAGVAVPPASSAVLALVVWAIYLADRWLDARCGADGSDRHRFAHRNPLAWIATACMAILAAAVIAFTALPPAHLNIGFIVASVTIGYLTVVHLIRAKRLLDRGVKEASVGVVFAAGAAIPLVAESRSPANWLPGVIAFAGLCWLNCTLIGFWEEGPAGPPLWAAIIAGCLTIAATLGAPLPVAAAVLGSTAALAMLHAFRTRVSVRAARVLADAVLLSPILVSAWV